MMTEDKQDTHWLDSKYWRLGKALLSLLTLFGSAIGLGLVYLQLEESTRLRRIDLALDFVERFNSEAYLGARNGALAPWLPYQPQLRLANAAGGMSRNQLSALVKSVVAKNRGTGGKLEQDVLTLAGFFDELWICVDNGACDAEVSCAYFKKRAADFNRFYGVVLDDVRLTFDAEKTGIGVTEIAKLEECG